MASAGPFGAFISYRHIEPDRRVAAWLQAALETFRVPKALVAAGAPPRVGRVFRDEEELAASADLSRAIQDALQRADALVVVCSPGTPASRWVNAEVERFAALGRADRIFAVLIDGEPTNAFPPALLAMGREPLAADLRPAPGESAGAARRTGLLKLLAGLLGLEFDALRRRDDERRRRRLRWAAAAGSALAVVFAALALAAVLQWQRAERELEISRAQTLAARAQIALADAQRADQLAPGSCATCPDAQRAALLALESLRIQPTINADAVLRRALWRSAHERLTATPAEGQALAAIDGAGRLQLRASSDVPGASVDAAAPKEPAAADPDLIARSPDGRLVLRRSTEGVEGWVHESAVLERSGKAQRIALLPHEWVIRLAVFSSEGRWLTTVTAQASADAEDPSATALVGSTVRVWDTATGEERTRVSLAAEDGIAAAVVDPEGAWLATVGRPAEGASTGTIRLWPLAPDTLARMACALLKRNLSPSEWATLVDTGPARATCPGLPAVSE